MTLAFHGFRKVFGSDFTSSGEIATTDHSVKACALRVSSLDLSDVSPEDTLTDAQIPGRRLVGELLGGSLAIHVIREAANISRTDLLAGPETTIPLPKSSGQACYETPAEQITPWSRLHSQVQDIFDSIQFLEELTGASRTVLNAATAAWTFNNAFHSE